MSQLLKRKYIKLLIVIVVIGIVFFFVLPASIPLILAFLTALSLEPLVRLVRVKGRINRKMAVLAVFLLFLSLLTASGYIVGTKVISEVIKFAYNIPIYVSVLNDVWQSVRWQIYDLSNNFPEELVVEGAKQLDQFINSIIEYLLAFVNVENVKSLFTNIPAFLVNLLVYLIALFLFMLDLPRIKNNFYSYLKDETAEKVRFMFANITAFFKGYLKGQFLMSVIIFVASLIGLLIIQPKYAVIMSLIIWFIDLVPILGSIVILGPWGAYQLLIGDVTLGVQLLILAAILLIIRRTLEPKVMGVHMGLSPLATLVSIFLGYKLLGLIGLFLGPLLVIIYQSAKETGMIRMNFKL